MKNFDGYLKKKLGNTYVLLSGGGEKSLGDFIGNLQWDNDNKKLKYKSASASDWSDLVTFGANAFKSTAYLPLSGGTMTGALELVGSCYNGYDGGTYGMNCNNSDIIGVNSILTSDLSDSWKESIGFKRSNGNWDTFRAADGAFYFGVNNGTEYTAIHSGNISNYSFATTSLLSNYLPLGGGTLSGGLLVSTSAYGSGQCHVLVTSNNRKCGLLIGTGGTNMGLYNDSLNEWMIYHNGTSTIVNGSCTGSAGYIEGTNNAASPGGALLRSGSGRADNATGDTWIYYDSLGGTSSPWGIKHDQPGNNILFYGSGSIKTTIALGESKITATTFAGNATSATTATYLGARSVAVSDLASTTGCFAFTSGSIITSGNDYVGLLLEGGGDKFQITAEGNTLYFRLNDSGGANTSWNSWVSFITSATIGSQSVNYASSAGSVAWGNVTGKPSSFTPASHTHSYLPLSGGTMTGRIYTESSIYGTLQGSNSGVGALHLNNSDITGVNTISTSDTSDDWTESLAFKRSNGNWDTFRAKDGTFYFGVNNGTEYTAIHSGNYTTYCAKASHSHSYLPSSGGTLSGNLTIAHATSATMTASSSNPKITFSESGTLPVHLTYTDYDSYRNPAGLKVVGGTDASPAWFEAEGNMYAANFYTTSDRSKKQNISLFSEHIRKFQLKDTEKWHYGVIAQEVEEMFRDGEEGNMTVNYNSVLSYYIGLLENKVNELETKIKNFRKWEKF